MRGYFFFSLLLVVLVATRSPQPTSRGAIIMGVNGDIITAVDFHGEKWEFYGDGYHEGQAVTLVVQTHNTANLEDDEILSIL